MPRVALILGSGATRSQVPGNTAKHARPPLDKGFFSDLRQTQAITPLLTRVQTYLRLFHGHHDIRQAGINSFEAVASILYSDVHAPHVRRNAFRPFLSLLQILSSRIADTTNQIRMHSHNPLDRLLYYLISEFKSQNVSIITFNYDIQLERALHHVQSRLISVQGEFFSFPGCYRLPSHDIRGIGGIDELVPTSDLDDSHDGIEVLKLHGSLNWYSGYNDNVPSQRQFFTGNRKFRIANVDSLPYWPVGVRTAAHRRLYGYPLLVPPVPHKSPLFHDEISGLWLLASRRLAEADELFIFGYSCPWSDQEAANLLRSTTGLNRRLNRITIIDPDTNVIRRFADLTEAKSIDWYADAREFLRQARSVSG